MTDENVNIGGFPSGTSLTLLERARQNDELAWQQLVDLYAPAIYVRCRKSWQLEAADAENIGQEVFLSVSRKLKDFERIRSGSFRKWLWTITDNKCRDFLRAKPEAIAKGGSNAIDALKNLPCEAASDDDDEESQRDLTSDEIVMKQAMTVIENEFSPRDWKMFWSIAIDSKHRQIVASEFAVSDNVVYLVLSRIRKRLKQVFEDLLDSDLYEHHEVSNEARENYN